MRFVLLAACIIVCALAADISLAAQPTGLPSVPQGLSNQQTAALTSMRAKVVAEGERLQHTVENQHAKCAHVGLPIPLASGETPDPNEAVLKERCDAEQAQIGAQVRKYAEDTKAYRTAIDAAVAAAPASKTMYPARVVLKGSVELVHVGKAQALISSTVIHLTKADQIATSAHARAAFTLADKSQFILGPLTEITLTTMVNDPSPAKRRIVIQLTKGTIRWISGDVVQARAEAINVALPAGSVRITASDVQANVGASGEGYVALLKGNVQVVPKETTASAMTLRPNDILGFTAAGVFASPKPLQPNEIRPL